MRTETQVSAGGVAFRRTAEGGVEVALIAVGDPQRPRWQLPKGRIDPGETREVTALREVREEAGIDTQLVRELETVDFWYQNNRTGERVRCHKFVHFFLLSYVGGDVRDHDREVHEARWFPIDAAVAALSFESERRVLRKARDLIA